MGMNAFAPNALQSGFSTFVVQNISSNPVKVVNIFLNPILPGTTRDLMQIEGVGCADISASLLKGEIRNKLLAQEISIVDSDVDLLQFNTEQQLFLQRVGITTGTNITSNNLDVIRREDILLDGNVDGVNNIFTIPNGEKFLETSIYTIIVYMNGVKQFYGGDYLISESGGVGTGYDTVIMTTVPSPTPAPPDVITADYYVKNVNPVF